MEINEYVRTDKGEIGKLKELKLDCTIGKRLVTSYTYRDVKENLVMFDNTKITQRFVDGSCFYLTDDELKLVEESIVKSSPNIIDLIEVGDYVNGYRVVDIGYLQDKVAEIHLDANDLFEQDIYREQDIKSIVTKEQFEEMEYRL